MENTEALSWNVAADYIWRPAKVSEHLVVASQGAVLLQGMDVSVLCPSGGLTRTFDPVGRARLFREFVECSPTPEGFRNFALSYGLLSNSDEDDAVFFVDVAGAPVVGMAFDLPDLPGAPLSWFQAYSALHQVAWRWDAMRGRDRAYLPILIGRDELRRVSGLEVALHLKAPAGLPSLPPEQAAGALLIGADPRTEEQIASAKSIARRETKVALATRITELASEGLSRHVGSARIRYERIGQSVRFLQDFSPQTLIGTLWMQCVWAICGLQDFARCWNCNKWLELSKRRTSKGKRGRRKDARFCPGDLCRATWHQNQKRALAETAGGKATKGSRNGKAKRPR